MSKQLVALLNPKQGACDCLMLKTPVKKMQKSVYLPIAFIVFNMLVFIPQVLFIFPLYRHIELVYINSAIIALVILFWILVYCSDPG